MSNQILIKQKEYKMAVFCAFSLLVFAFIMWQWVVTVHELDALAEGMGRYKFLKPQADLEDVEKDTHTLVPQQKGVETKP